MSNDNPKLALLDNRIDLFVEHLEFLFGSEEEPLTNNEKYSLKCLTLDVLESFWHSKG